ncbi:MAG: methylenetetrahydrofolate reductase C-terminal domain-containing protein [Thermoplasmatales archaeon]|nr:MAG: methylenetetrahydrofolate reductase C-terminal domain-containing protein [Thermoplasmatales archaeon]
MIITKQKDIKDILYSIKNGPVFLIGCSECATVCHTGGEEEILSMKEKLENENIEVSGWVILDPACHFLNDKRLLKNHMDEINRAKKILVLACGNGVQTVSEIFDTAEVISGTETLFLGEIKRLGNFEKRCSLCGECIQDLFNGLCPISRCPKEMLNGPCGGSIDGKCEISSDLECIWDIIFLRFKKKGQLYRLKEIKEPKDWSKSTVMRRTL